jgi:hypothetical protein
VFTIAKNQTVMTVFVCFCLSFSKNLDKNKKSGQKYIKIMIHQVLIFGKTSEINPSYFILISNTAATRSFHFV